MSIKPYAGLGNDIWILIFEQMYSTRSMMSGLRSKSYQLPNFLDISLVSYQFYELIRKFIFRDIVLRGRLQVRILLLRKNRERLAKYTNTITLPPNAQTAIGCDLIEELLRECTQLKDIQFLRDDHEYHYSNSSYYAGDVLRHIADTYRNIRVHIDRHPTSIDDISSIKPTIPVNNLVSLDCIITMEEDDFIYTSGSNVLKQIGDVLVDCLNLRRLSLEFDCRPSEEGGGDFIPESWYFKDLKGRLPPLTELALSGYSWPASREHSLLVWDLSNLTGLSLVNLNLFRFTDTVPLELLKGLRSLTLSDVHIGHYPKSYLKDPYLWRLKNIWPALSRLEELEILELSKDKYVLKDPDIIRRLWMTLDDSVKWKYERAVEESIPPEVEEFCKSSKMRMDKYLFRVSQRLD